MGTRRTIDGAAAAGLLAASVGPLLLLGKHLERAGAAVEERHDVCRDGLVSDYLLLHSDDARLALEWSDLGELILELQGGEQPGPQAAMVRELESSRWSLSTATSRLWSMSAQALSRSRR